jgi:hypothetical protein
LAEQLKPPRVTSDDVRIADLESSAQRLHDDQVVVVQHESGRWRYGRRDRERHDAEFMTGHGGGLGQVLKLAPHRLDGDPADPGPQHGLAEDVHDLAAPLVQDRLPADLRRDKRPDGLRRDAVLSEELLAVRHLAHERRGLEQARHERGLVFSEQLSTRGLQGAQFVLERCGTARAIDPVFPHPVLCGRLPAKGEQRPGLGADRRRPCLDLILGRKL